jgi:TRAP-type C4-dicarboxylate transport system permease large subunit
VEAGLGAVLPLMMPAILLGGILLGIATPTEIAAFAVLYGLAVAMGLYREMSLRTFMHTVLDTAALTGVLLFIFAAASGFSWTLTVAYLPQRLVELLHAISGSTDIFIVGSIVLLVLVGVLLEGLPSLNVVAPLLIPIAGKLGLAAGMQVTQPNIAPFRALMSPVYERISAYAGSDNVKKFQQMAE